LYDNLLAGMWHGNSSTIFDFQFLQDNPMLQRPNEKEFFYYCT